MQEQKTRIATVFDSEEQYVGQVYGKALLSAAQREGKLDAIADELESLIHDVFDKNQRFEANLANPRLSFERKWAMLDRVFGNKMDGTLLRFLKVVCRRNRMSAIRAIQQSASKQRDEIAGRIQVSLTVAQPLDTAAENALVAKLKTVFNKDVRLVTRVNPGILGGLIIRVGDTVFDASVDGQLRTLRKSVGAKTEGALRNVASNLVQAS
jgi:F-type H+-transporting ATPase subunit delta